MTIPMPEPAAYIRSSSMLSPSPRCVASLAYVSQIDQERGELYEPVITTTQAEAYANARARAALEEAATIIEKNALDCIPTTAVILLSQAAAIRAMIPKKAKS